MPSTRLGRLEQNRSDQLFHRFRRILIGFNIVFAVLLLLGTPIWYSAVIQWRLNRLGPRDGKHLPWVRTQLESSNEGIRSQAACALARVGTNDKKDLGKLLDLLRTEQNNRTVVHGVTWSLGILGKNNPLVVDRLIEALEYSQPTARCGAAYALGQHGKSAVRAVPALTRGLSDSESGWAAASALGEIGAGAREAIPQLTLLVSNDDWAVRVNAADALGKMGILPDDTIQVLQEHRDDTNPHVRRRISGILTSLGK